MNRTQVGRAAWLLLAGAPVACLAAAHAAATATANATAGAGAEDAAFQYVAKPGDTLIGVASRLLEQPSRWRDVARASKLRDPNRIAVGHVLVIPLPLLRSVAEPAVVVSVRGDARSGDQRLLAPGQQLAEGQSIQTGADGNVTLRLVDGTLLRIRSASHLGLAESRKLPGAAAARAAASLEAGRVEVQAGHARAGMPGFRVRTPQGVLAVRGTEFRVESDAGHAVTRAEVLQGEVQVGGQGVGAGYGGLIDARGQPSAPIALLPAPTLDALPALQERVLVRFALPGMPGAAAWRAQVAADAAFDTVFADIVTTTGELRFGDLPDGDYVLRVRAIDPHGLQGLNADRAFKLKARPEPPLPSTPSARAVFYDPHVEFAWAASAEAAQYQFQLFVDGQAARPARDLAGLTATTTTAEGLLPGHYRWRIRSVRANGDAGPWSEPREFEIRPQPPSPPPPKSDDDTLFFSWEGAPGQHFEFQVARNASFTAGLVSRELDRPELALPKPGSGRFWIRLRVRDADGFVGPWTATQTLDLPNCLRDGAGRCVKGGDGQLEVMP